VDKETPSYNELESHLREARKKHDDLEDVSAELKKVLLLLRVEEPEKKKIESKRRQEEGPN